MQYRIYSVNPTCSYPLKKIVGLDIIGKVQVAEVFPLLVGCQYVNYDNIVEASAVQGRYYRRTYEACSTCYYNHGLTSLPWPVYHSLAVVNQFPGGRIA